MHPKGSELEEEVMHPRGSELLKSAGLSLGPCTLANYLFIN